ncbi:hypothetical protein DRP05_06435 [Archaeoglobales archaeon]|nr:MAG: hypothetical protein DRP05_06435 [Archaeoglobales archaeon]
MEFNVVWMEDGEIKRVVVDGENYEYTVGTKGAWRMLIADEDKKVEKGKQYKIKVKEVIIPPDSISIPCSCMRNALGFVEATGKFGRPGLIEEGRKIDFVVFTAIEDGEIKNGDLLGVINVFPVMITRFAKKPEIKK